MAFKRAMVVLIVLAVVGSAVAGVFFGASEARRAAQAGAVIGLIHIEGAISSGGGGGLFDVVGTADRITQWLEEARLDPNVAAVVLRINTPGGTAAASQEIAEEVRRLRDAGKIVVVSMGDSATSGGYWIAAHANHVMAMPGTVTGSIGVIISSTNMEELFEKLGLEHVVIKSGPHKDILSPTRPMSPTERDLLQAMVDDMYEQFVEGVIDGRRGKVSGDEVRRLADGRILTGRQAMEHGLVDEMGNLRQAIERTADLAGLDRYRLHEYGATPWRRILQGEVQAALRQIWGREAAPAFWRWDGGVVR